VVKGKTIAVAGKGTGRRGGEEKAHITREAQKTKSEARERHLTLTLLTNLYVGVLRPLFDFRLFLEGVGCAGAWSAQKASNGQALPSEERRREGRGAEEIEGGGAYAL
jgi:hypothetical protein